MPRLKVGLLTLALTALSACGMGDLTVEEVAPNLVPERPTYATDVEPILARRCVRCHSADSGPGFEPLLDTEGRADVEACESWVAIQSGFMPPGAMDPLTAPEMLTVERWTTTTLGRSVCAEEDD